MSDPGERDLWVTRRRGAMLLVVTDDGKLLLHHRDDKTGIAHPDAWAGFGGGREGDESAEDNVRREMREETGLDVESPTFLTEVVDVEGDGHLVAVFYVRGGIRPGDIDLQEGAGVGVWSLHELAELKVAPFIRRVIESHLVPILEGR